jgi:ribosomal protein S18 acetylase RimI-like enzyme
MVIEIRSAVMPADTALIKLVDTSFETNEIYHVASTGNGFSLSIERLERLRRKTFPLDDLGEGRPWQDGWLALDRGTPAGFAATRIEPFNRRCVIWHFYVSPSHRGQGIGRRLLDRALDKAAADGATSAWLETTSLNAPGIAAYRRLGFDLCGLDMTLYNETAAVGEVALFMQKALKTDFAWRLGER